MGKSPSPAVSYLEAAWPQHHQEDAWAYCEMPIQPRSTCYVVNIQSMADNEVEATGAPSDNLLSAADKPAAKKRSKAW